MTKKEFTYKGKALSELEKMSIKEFSEIVPSRQRRSLKRGLTDDQKQMYEKLKKGKTKIKTHSRDAIITPAMLNKIISVYTGKEFIDVRIIPEMLGHYLGEFALTRKKVGHHAPGIGATRSSASLSVK